MADAQMRNFLLISGIKVKMGKSFPLGCIWINDLVREKEMEMEKVDDLMVSDGWII